MAALWVVPAQAAPPPPTLVQKAPSISTLAEDAQTRHQLAPALDSESEEEPSEYTTGPAAPGAPGERRWVRKFEREDFTSYYAKGVLAEARAAFDQGQYRRVWQLLEGQEATRPVRYLRAMSARRAHRWAEAAEEFSSLAEEYPPLRDAFLVEAGRALERLRRLNEAARSYEAVTASSRHYDDARFGLARIRERQRDHAGAVAALTPLVQASGAPLVSDSAQARAWSTIARLARLQGDYNGEHRALLALWALHPFSRQTLAARQRLRGLPFPTKWLLTRAETLLTQHHNADAMRLLRRLLPRLALPDPLACRAHFAYGTALRKERQHARAVRVLRPVVERCRDDSLRPRAMYVLGYSESVIAPAAAIRTYLNLEAEYPGHPYADDALFHAAREALERGRTSAAMEHLDRLIAHHPDGNFAAEALFQRFWIHRAVGRHAAGLEDLVRIEALQGTGSTHDSVQRARYWRARTLHVVGRAEEAQSLLERVASEGAATWYGLLARSRLAHESPERARRITERLLAPVGPAEVWPLEAGSLAEDPHFAAGLELLRLKHPGAAAELLAVDRKGRSEESVRLLFHILHASGQERQARTVARALLREGLAGPTEAEARLIYEAAYPHAFRRLVVQHSRAARVNPDLMQALIREESAFNPRARSPAGALGLAQLMPRTALSVARTLNVPHVTTASLFEPRHNIRLGSAYLGSLQRRFAGNVAYAVASYNAGPGAVSRWLARFPDAELDEWVEQIPVEETRHYVKRVLGSAVAYQLLYDADTLTTLAIGERTSSTAGAR